MAIAIPSFYMDPARRADSKMQGEMRSVQTAVEAWGNEHGKFPTSDAELAQALAAQKTALDESPFQRAGRPVPYQLKLAAGATGPMNAAERPGMISVAVDPAGTHYWMSATTLPKAIADHAIPLAESGTGPQFVITGEAVPPSPAVEPAKAKIGTKK